MNNHKIHKVLIK